ncbi:unnamed protein product [Callosobruchus maculatus]|uniref:Endonuclease/exonuclease/phosphatase domain-containing protein n=1 Tax=Callosobruchus maculatus TaxID=64391 RepID=A0A653CAU3_CALMS|nr:unnamed protein product [Callosobruchus maculatus]
MSPELQQKYALNRNNCLCISENNINAVLDTKVESSLDHIRSEIESIRKDILSQTVIKVQPPADPPRYSDVLRNKTQPAVVIRPKNANQSVVQTRSDILKSVDPVEANLHLGKVRDIKDGGLLVGCKSKADNLKLLSIAKQKLGNSYDIKEVTGINPRIRLVGMSKAYSEEQINSYLLKSNPEVFCGDVECTIGLKRGGGVAVAVRNDFKSSSVDLGACPSFNNINPKIDILVIKIAIQYSNIYVISLYIPPQISVSDYETLVEAIQSLAVLHGSSIFIVGDFNVTSYAAYLDSNISNGFTNSLNALAGFFNAEQYNYVHNENGNLLDLVFSNAICFVEHATDPLVYEDIHHPALIVTAKYLPVDKKNDVLYSNFVCNYNFRKANFQLLYEMIMNVNWANLEIMTNVDSACELLYSEIYKILDYCVPKVKRIYTHKYPSWFSRHLIQILKQKSVAFRRFKQTGNIRYQVEFQKLRSELKAQASAAYRHYIQSLESDISKNSSTFWSFVNRKTNNHGIPKDILYNGQSMTNPEDISGAFAEYFGNGRNAAVLWALHGYLVIVKKTLPTRTPQRSLQLKILRNQYFSSVKINKQSREESITSERRMCQSNLPLVTKGNLRANLSIIVPVNHGTRPLKRNPEITERTAKGVTASSTNVPASDIKKWFSEIAAFLQEKGLMDILNDPDRILNADERCFNLCPKNDEVLAPKGARNVYEVEHASSKQQ